MKPWEATKLIDVLDEMNLKEDNSKQMVVEKLRKLSNEIFNISRKVLGDPAEKHEKWVDNPDLIFVNNIMEDLIESPHKRITKIEIEKCNQLYKQYKEKVK